MGTIAETSDAGFEADVLKSSVPILVDFWAPWCGPCRMQTPILEKLVPRYQGKITFLKLNTDENQDTAVKLGITGIPTMIIFKGGQPAERLVGLRTEAQLIQILDAMI
ncbi:MAG: thioredoxin [Spirochaetota bacterium]